MKNKQNKIITIIVCVVCFFVIYHFLLNYELKKNGVIERAEIVSVSSGGKASVNFEYVFIHKNRKYTSGSPAGVKYPDEFIGKVFPVIVSVVTKNSTILTTPRQFKEYNITFPDSLKWVLEYAKD